MNPFVTIIFAVCCGIAELSPPVVMEHWMGRAMLILSVTMISPLTAVLQTRWVASSLVRSRESRKRQDRIVGRLSLTHSIVWAATGILTFLLLDWPSVVARWDSLVEIPVIYELVLLSPLMISLVGSWLVFFDIQQYYVSPRNQWTFNWAKRWEFAWERIRMHLIVMLAPLVLLLTGMRFAYLLQQFSVPQIVIGGALLGLWVSAMLPYLFLMFLSTRKFSDEKQLHQLKDTCLDSGVAVQKIRIWETGNRVANAAVAGFLPGFRVVLLTDVLIEHFSAEEVKAIVRHEAGHIKLQHLPLKVLFIMLPMAALMIDQTQSLGLHQGLESLLGSNRIFDISVVNIAQGIVASLFVVYLFAVLRWLNHQLEYEADLFAALELKRKQPLCVEINDQGLASVDVVASTANEATRSALEKLAVIAPHQVHRSTFMHPSIMKRVRLLDSVADNPRKAREFQRSLRRRNVLILLPWVALLALAIFV